MSKTMQAIVFDEPGDEGVLQLGHVPVPELKPTSVRIKVEAAGVNRADIMQRLGNYPPPEGSSEILGLEAAGTISEVGSACTGDWKVGDRVMAVCSGGAYAEEVVVDAGSIMKVPESWKMVEAAGFMEVTLTAYLNIFQIGGATKGKSVLIHGGGSGVGSQAIAMCKAKGVTTFVTAGSDDKCERCLQRGASYVLNYKTEKIVDLVKGMTKGKGVDVILDCVGAPYLEQNLECLAMDGKVVYIGLMGGAVAEKANLGVLLRKRASLIGSTLRNRSLSFKAELVAGLRKDFADERKRGDIKPIIDKVVPLESAADAHRRMAGSTHYGKIILNVKPV